MNIAGLLLPKSTVAYLYDDFTLRQTLEKMRYHGYTNVPVLTRQNKYVGTIGEGDLLWYFMEKGKIDFSESENIRLRDIIEMKYYPPVPINMDIREVVELLVNYNFLPVVDDLDSFVGIITRNKILQQLAKAGRITGNNTTVACGNPQIMTKM